MITVTAPPEFVNFSELLRKFSKISCSAGRRQSQTAKALGWPRHQSWLPKWRLAALPCRGRCITMPESSEECWRAPHANWICRFPVLRDRAGRWLNFHSSWTRRPAFKSFLRPCALAPADPCSGSRGSSSRSGTFPKASRFAFYLLKLRCHF